MKFRITLLSFIMLALVANCRKSTEKSIEKFSLEKPFCVEIKKERSYFQAKKIVDRLNEMGTEAYMIKMWDSTEGEWYSILSGAIATADSVQSFQSLIEDKFKLKETQVLNYTELNNFSMIDKIDTTIVQEKKKIDAKSVDLPTAILATAQKFPKTNALYLEKMSIFHLSEARQSKINEISPNFSTDLPRGISLSKIAKNCQTYAEVIGRDNLYGDRVTISIMKLIGGPASPAAATLINASNRLHFETARYYAELILESGKYPREEMNEVEIPSYCKLNGYQVVIEPKANSPRTYYVLVDENYEYLIFSQSTDKSDEELRQMLAQLGNGNGLNDYDEFYNTFYTIPEKLVDEDEFLGFCIDKLDWSYAKSKGYQVWAKKMVGHWVVRGFFFSPNKGIWNFVLFDLLTDSNQNYIYGDLYANDANQTNKQISIYGVKGYSVFKDDIDWSRLKAIKFISEVNFGRNRFVYAINNSFGRLGFTESDFIRRGEAMQFTQGGYQATND